MTNINRIHYTFFPLRTYKCGHCGKTHLDNAEFHRHSALTHGDKIPDLVKDPEVRLMRQQIRNLDYVVLIIKHEEGTKVFFGDIQLLAFWI